ncbi:MAG TPA: hypothetical protein VI756_28200 [Blastocatellia bacterium]
MSSTIMELLEDANKLSEAERRELADLILKGLEMPAGERAEIAEALKLVEETYGSIKAPDRQTLISLAEDEEFCGY